MSKRILNQVISHLEKCEKMLDEIVEQRNDYINERSDKWIESDRGEQYEYTTNDIEGFSNDILSLIDELKQIEL